MIRRLLAGSAAAGLLALAPLAHAQHTPAKPAPILDVMATFRAEVAHGTLTQAQYNQLEGIWNEGANALADSAVRSVRRSPLTDPAARNAAQNALDDVTAAFASRDAGVTVDRLLDFGQQGALAYGEPFVSLAQVVVEDYLSLEQRLLVARQEMGNADPSAMLNMQHELDKENQDASSELNNLKTIMQSVAGTNASSLTPSQRARAVELIDIWYNRGMPLDPPKSDQPPDPSGTASSDDPVPYTTNCPNGDCPAPTDNGDTSGTSATGAPHPDHTAANAARRPGPSGNDPTGQNDPGLNPSRNTSDGSQPPANPPPASQPVVQAPRLPTQPPRPAALDPVLVVVVQHGSNDMGDVKFGSDGKGGRVPIEYDAPDGSKTYYRQDANGKTVPAVFVDANGHSWGYDAKGNPSVDLGGPGGGGDAAGGAGGATGFGSPGRSAMTGQPVKAQFPPPDTSGFPSFAGVSNGGAYTLARVVPIYNGWTYSQANAGSIMLVPSNQIAGPSKAGGGGPVNDIFGPSSVMTSLSLDTLSGLTLTSGLRVGTPVGQNWTIAFVRIPSFDDLCGR